MGMKTIVVGSIASAGSKLTPLIELLATPSLPEVMPTPSWVAVKKATPLGLVVQLRKRSVDAGDGA
jgi:hypothetical protein